MKSFIDVTEKNNRRQRKALIPIENTNHCSTSLRSNSRIFLKNGNSMKEQVRIQNKVITILNTCAFDAVSEVVSSAYAQFVNFRNFIDAARDKNPYFNFISDYSNKNRSPDVNVYANRADILSECYTIDNGIINCYGNAQELVEKIFPSGENAFLKKIGFCCQQQTIIRAYNTLYPHLDTLKSLILENDKGMSNLEESLKLNISETIALSTGRDNAKCNLCLQALSKISFDVSKLLIIDTEMCYPPGYAFNTRPPTIMKICDNTFNLIGVVEYRPGHYVAHSYIDGKYIEIDDLSFYNRIEEATVRSELPRDLQIHLLLYIQCN